MNQGILIINDEKGVLLAFKKKLQILHIGMDTAAALYCWRRRQSSIRYLKKCLLGQQCPKYSHFLALSQPTTKGDVESPFSPSSQGGGKGTPLN